MRQTRVRLTLVGGAIVASLALSLVAFFLVPRHPVAASAHSGSGSINLVTRGDVQALFNTLFTGCGALSVHGFGFVEGPPCEDRPRARISVFSGVVVDHFCVDDWHLINIWNADTNTANLAQTTFAYFLDGAPLTPTQQTPIKPVNPQFNGGVGTFSLNNGVFMAPGAISVGSHTLRGVVTEPPSLFFDQTVTFSIDPSGTGACLTP